MSTYSNTGITFSNIPSGGTLFNNPPMFTGTAQLPSYQYTINTSGWSPPAVLDANGNINANNDIIMGGKSLKELFNKIEDRLAILVPDPAKLEKFEALKKAYENYKMLEKIAFSDDPKEIKK